jgi:hypothetical protein
MQGDASPNLRKCSFRSSKNLQEFIKKNIVTVPANTQMTIFFEKLTIRKKSHTSKTAFPYHRTKCLSIPIDSLEVNRVV